MLRKNIFSSFFLFFKECFICFTPSPSFYQSLACLSTLEFLASFSLIIIYIWMCICTNRYIQPALFVFIVCIWFQGWLHCTGQETHPWQRLSLFLAFVPCSSLCLGGTPGRCPSSLLTCLLTLPLFWSSRREFHSRLGVFWYFPAQYIIFPWVLNSIFVCLRYRTPGDKICRSVFYLLFISFFHWAFI